MSQQHRGPSKGHFNPLGPQAGRVWVGHTETQQPCVISKPIEPVARDAGKCGHLPTLLCDTGTTESPDTWMLCWMSHKVTGMSPATGTSHLQSHCPAPSPSSFSA